MVMFEHSPSVIGHSLELVLDKRNLPIEFQIDITSRGLLLSKGNLPLNAISRFVIGSFKKGAMHMVGRIVVEREEIGVALLAEGAAKAAFLLSSVEKGNARAYLRFIQLSIAVLSKNQRLAGGFAKCAIRLAFEIIAKYGGEKFVYAKQILTQCVYTIKDAFQVLGEQESQQFFDTLATKKKKFVVQYVVTSIRAAEQRKKTENLVAFSTHERGHKQGEWQTLDVEGGVASDSD
jgi:hypothetical protein